MVEIHVGVWAGGARGVRGAGEEHGFTLVEVVVAAAIIMLVLLPSAALLSSSTSVLDANRSKVVAANLASGQLEQDRAAADDQTWSGSPPAPSLPTQTTKVTVGGVSYTVTPSVGWCGEQSGSWDHNPASGAVGYGVVITVRWLDTHSVSAAEILTTPVPAISSAPSSGTGCPL